MSMQWSTAKCIYQFIYCTLIIVYAAVIRAKAQNVTTRTNVRIVYPNDFVRFSCHKNDLDDNSPTRPSTCTWTFTLEGSGVNTTTTACILINGDMRDTNKYSGYATVPEKARTISCEGDTHPQPLNIQNVKLATPLTREVRSVPKIVLQRFSDDYGVRLAAHDVTNKHIEIDGSDLQAIKLMCIHSSSVKWINITEGRQRIIRELEDRDSKWIRSKLSELEEKYWDNYLKFLLELEHNSFRQGAIVSENDGYTSTLNIRRITDMTSRTYVCSTYMDNKVSSNVTILVKNPRTIGPDEIQLIQQIISILDSMSQNDGKKEPWYTLGSIITIGLLLFMYYCKKKLDQPKGQAVAKTDAPATEETEMTVRLRRNEPRRENISRDQDQERGPESVEAENR